MQDSVCVRCCGLELLVSCFKVSNALNILSTWGPLVKLGHVSIYVETR